MRRTSLSMVKRWWQLSALLKSMLPNKVKQFVPKVFYSVSTVCLPRQSAFICSIVPPRACKGYFQWSAVTSNCSQYEITEWAALLMTPTHHATKLFVHVVLSCTCTLNSTAYFDWLPRSTAELQNDTHTHMATTISLGALLTKE